MNLVVDEAAKVTATPRVVFLKMRNDDTARQMLGVEAESVAVMSAPLIGTKVFIPHRAADSVANGFVRGFAQ